MKTFLNHIVRIALLAAVVVLAAGSLQADVVLVTAPEQLQVNGTINWGTFGPEGMAVPNGSTAPISGLPGQNVTIANFSAGFVRVDQGGLWSGGFVPGDKLLSTDNGSDSPISVFANLRFLDGGIGGLGGYIQMDPARGIDLGDPSFTAFITASDVNSEIILGGGSIFSPDGNPIFIGVRDNGPTFNPIQTIDLKVQDSAGFFWHFAFDPIVQAAPGPAPAAAAPVPEPSSLAMLCVAGVAGVAARARNRKRKTITETTQDQLS